MPSVRYWQRQAEILIQLAMLCGDEQIARHFLEKAEDYRTKARKTAPKPRTSEPNPESEAAMPRL